MDLKSLPQLDLGGMRTDVALKRAESSVRGLHEGVPAKQHEKEIADAATQFEGLMVQEMLKSMWATVPKDGMLSGSKEEETYQDWFREALAKNISETSSLGIKEVVIRDIKQTEARRAKGAS